MDEGQDLEHFLQGDDFVTEEERQEQQAKERRLARKRRLLALEANRPADTQLPPTDQAEPATHKSKVEQPIITETLDAKAEEEEERDGFDMFSSSVSPASAAAMPATVDTKTGTEAKNVDQQQDWDDTEGYYKATIGEVMRLDLPQSSSDVQFRISGVIGKGVFSTVLKCATESSNLPYPMLPSQVAIKVIRHNDTMAKAAVNEIRFLQRLSSKVNAGVISLILPTDSAPLEYRGHTLLIFPYMEYNLRDVLAKFGKGVGLSLEAVRSYFAQLLSALWHLKQHRIIHSDLKPDNILVSSDYKEIRLADFGSAVDITESIEVAPYLVSRFYRAPEIILGLTPTHAIDLWSLAVTAAELFLGTVLFQGTSNNDMINVMMVHLGACSNRLIRQHLAQTNRYPIPTHFTQEAPYLFRKISVDPVSGQPVHKNVVLQKYTPTLQEKLLKAKSAKDSRTMVLQFADLLKKCLMMDPSKRIEVKAALQHEFFKDKAKS